MALEQSDRPFPARVLADPRAVRALAHPVRIALIEALGIHGSLTATRAGSIIGETATTCSFHLRQLAKYRFVVEAGRGPGRERPWKLTEMPVSIRAPVPNPEGLAAELAVSRAMRDRVIAKHDAWWAVQGSYPDEWRRAGAFFNLIASAMTPDELRELSTLLEDKIVEIEERRAGGDAPAQALPVEVLFIGFPLAPPGADAEPARAPVTRLRRSR